MFFPAPPPSPPPPTHTLAKLKSDIDRTCSTPRRLRGDTDATLSPPQHHRLFNRRNRTEDTTLPENVVNVQIFLSARCRLFCQYLYKKKYLVVCFDSEDRAQPCLFSSAQLKIQTHESFKRTLIYSDINTQSAQFRNSVLER